MPQYKLVVAPAAVNDIQRAVDYYNSQQKGLGKRFLTDLKSELKKVTDTPYTRAIRYDNIRLAVMNKFPYAAHYYVNDDKIIVLGVISMFMNPDDTWTFKAP